jgi:hypothetical protein
MWYYVVDYIPFGNGSTPALPAGTGFMLLAGPEADPTRWGIFKCDDEVPLSKHVRAVDDALRKIIWSAERYPPALALARDRCGTLFDGQVPALDEFCEVYRDSLIEHMRQQPRAPYVFAEAVGEEPAYLTRGQFYWVLRHLRGASAVKWVSADYFVYENPASDFALSEEQLAALLLPFPPAV